MKKEKFWNFIAKNYDDEVGEQTVATAKNHLEKSDKVLDFGCARGAYTVVLADDVGEIRGIDISPAMIELARKKAPHIRFDVATIDEITENYDVVLAFNILHVLENLENVIDKIHDILKPGGRFISVTACMKEQAGMRIAGSFMKLFRVLHVNLLTAGELQGMIGERFEIVVSEILDQNLAMIVAKKK
jgi:2-polyprenyl-3-methyl-5-hydroxy-6-metoxy-1,4-benzoquinol methylase